MNPFRVLPLLFAAAFLASSCAPEKTLGDQADRLSFTQGSPDSPRKPLKFGKGLNGRTENGKKVYTVLVGMTVSKGGKVTQAYVRRSDAPERLQWATVKAAKALRPDPSLKPGRYMKAFIYHGFEVQPG